MMMFFPATAERCFNTQPPEGGWFSTANTARTKPVFQHAAARRRLDFVCLYPVLESLVSTRSRPKAAGLIYSGNSTN